MGDHRSRDRMILDILEICAEGENITKIVYQANTNLAIIKAYLDLLLKKDLIECLDASLQLYKTSAKGIDIMNRLRKLQEELCELDDLID